MNSAILDSGTLSACLRDHKGDLGVVLEEFERRRSPENRAFVQLVQVRSDACFLSTCCSAHAPCMVHCMPLQQEHQLTVAV